MKCDEIEDYLDGSLTGSRLEMFEEHLESCPRCRSELRRQEDLDRALTAAARSLPPAPPRLLDRLDREIAVLERRQSIRWRWAVAAALIFVGVGVRLGLNLEGDAPPDADRIPTETVISDAFTRVELVPDPDPVARVEFADSSGSLTLPVVAENVNATIVFVYPVLSRAAPPGVHDSTE